MSLCLKKILLIVGSYNLLGIMMLEDFFSWPEVNDGLTDPARVKELVTAMQKEKDSVVKNVSDVTRQWSAVAKAIAATKNRDCLLLFIQLDGLSDLTRWLKDAENLWNDTSDSMVEDAITNLLRAVENLQVDKDKLISSGLWATVNHLVGHKSSKVQDRAKALFNNWNEERENDTAQLTVENTGTLGGEGKAVSAENVGSGSLESSNKDINASRGSLSLDKKDEESKDDMPTSVSENLEAEKIKNRTSVDATMEKNTSHADSSSLSKPASENLNINSQPPRWSESTTVTETSSSADLKQGNQEEEMHAPVFDWTDDVKQMQHSPKKIDNPKSISNTDNTDALDSATEPGIVKNSNATEKDCSSNVSSSAGLRTAISEAKCRISDDNSSMVFRRKEDGDCKSDVLQDSKNSEQKVKLLKDSSILFRRTENDGPVERVNGDNSYRSEGGLPRDYNFPKPRMLRKDYAIDKKSDLDLDYGIVDPLELARQVAIEVEREVEDSRERSCGSSGKELSGKVQQPESPNSVSGTRFQTEQGSAVEVETGPDLSLDSPLREEPATSSGNLEIEQVNGAQDGESSQVTEAAQELEANPGKGLSHFDLNEEVWSEDPEHQGDITSPPVSVVSASRAAAAPGMPVAPLQFEGTLGWKGSAATSAFRTASPRRGPDDSGVSAGGSSGSSKQNRGFLNFDLNIAESGDDRIIDTQLGKEIPLSSRLASGESSVEASTGRLERLGLDLNRISDDGDAPQDWQPKGELLHQRNGHHSQSPSSSSSKQPLRNFDLNDQPIFAKDLSSNHYHKSPHGLSSSGGIGSDGSVISIMGMKVEVNRGKSAAQTFPLPNGRTPEPSTEINFVRSGSVFGMGPPALYSHPVYSYNSLAAGSALPFSAPMYGPGGPIPYMVDSRGAPVVPQIMGSSSALPPAFPQPPFMFTMTGNPSSSGIAPLRNNLDLNSGLILGGGNTDMGGGFMQFLNPAQVRPIDDCVRSNAQSSTSSGINGKRKEPDGGWEPYPLKHHSQPWR